MGRAISTHTDSLGSMLPESSLVPSRPIFLLSAKLNSVQFGTCSFLTWRRAVRLHMGRFLNARFLQDRVTCRCEPLGSGSGGLARFGAACSLPALARAVFRAARGCARWVRDGDRHP